jgi:hypothetical protein
MRHSPSRFKSGLWLYRGKAPGADVPSHGKRTYRSELWRFHRNQSLRLQRDWPRLVSGAIHDMLSRVRGIQGQPETTTKLGAPGRRAGNGVSTAPLPRCISLPGAPAVTLRMTRENAAARLWLVTTPVSASPARPARFRRPVVALALSDLHGPGEGILEVPRHLAWSGGQDCGHVDTGNRHAVTVAYESVLDAARAPEDLAACLNAGLLTALWPAIGMAPARRRAWEAVNPQLAAARLAHSPAA